MNVCHSENLTAWPWFLSRLQSVAELIVIWLSGTLSSLDVSLSKILVRCHSWVGLRWPQHFLAGWRTGGSVFWMGLPAHCVFCVTGCWAMKETSQPLWKWQAGCRFGSILSRAVMLPTPHVPKVRLCLLLAGFFSGFFLCILPYLILPVYLLSHQLRSRISLLPIIVWLVAFLEWKVEGLGVVQNETYWKLKSAKFAFYLLVSCLFLNPSPQWVFSCLDWILSKPTAFIISVAPS